MSRNLDEWRRAVALSFAQLATPAEPEPSSADDSHLAEEAAIAADLARNVNKGQILAQRNDEAALAAQVMNLDAMRRAGW